MAFNPFDMVGPAVDIARDFFGYQESEKARDEAMSFNRDTEVRNTAEAERFAKNSVSWRVADALNAGIHPLAALGMQGFTPPASANFVEPNYNKAKLVQDMGQNVSRAVYKMSTAGQRERAMSDLTLEHARLENELLRSQIARIQNVGPAYPGDTNFVPGQGDSGLGLVDRRPMRSVVSEPGRPAQEAGWRPDVSYSRTDSGFAPMIPTSLTESLEDDLIGKLMWRVRNQLLPNIGMGGRPPKSQLPRGYNDWHWDRSAQEWRPFKVSDEPWYGGYGDWSRRMHYRDR